jgi:quercetin dioxygenase-like cupin family protein
MRLPHRESIDLGPSAYEKFLKREGLPVITGYFVEDVMKVEVKPWERMGVLGCYLNLANQQETDAYVCEIPPRKETLPQRHLFEAIIYVARGQGATTIWQGGTSKRTFEWSQGAVFALPLNASYQHYNVSKDEPVRLLGGTNCPHLLNLFHNEDFIFRNPFDFRDRFRDTEDYFRQNDRLAIRCWETNLIPDVNQFLLDDYPMKGKGVRIMRFSLAETTYGCHIQEFPVGSRSLFHRHGPGAMIIITHGEGYVMLWREGEAQKGYDFRVGSIYAPGDLMYHGHFNTGATPMRHFAIRENSPKYTRDRFRNPLHDMIPLEEEPAGIHKEYLEELARKGISAGVSIVKE